MNQDPVFIIVDLFGGGGGDATGFFNARLDGQKIAKVIICVNHDEVALKTHAHNYPFVKHFREDIRTVDLSQLKSIVDYHRSLYPAAYLVIWGSFPCPHFSKALGNKPKDEGIRTMARSLYMNFDTKQQKHIPGNSYIQVLDPDYIWIENVEEFMSWGPLCDKGRPISRKNGQDWMAWKTDVNSFGYYDDWRELNSADFGADTSRNRLFGIFARHGLPIAWPEPTHSKNPQQNGMFGSLKPWNPVKNRIDFNDAGKSIIHRKKKLTEKTIQGIIKGVKKFALNGDEYFLYHYYGNSFSTSIGKPCPSFRTKSSVYLIQAFIHNPSHGGNCTSINSPCPVIVARQDKAPLRLVTCIKNEASVVIEDGDSPAYRELKQMMIDNNIQDILYRPLRIQEKKVIQGFPADYHFYGTLAQQNKQIGNSVVPLMAQVIAEAMAQRIIDKQKNKVA